MDTSSLKPFAQQARRDLLEAVERKLDYVLTADTPDLRAASAQVERLRAQSVQNRSQLIERVAYTWFNRLAALRFLDARGWHPFRVRIVTPASASETQPEILRLVRTEVIPDQLRPYTDPARLGDLLDGRLPSSDPQGEVYRHLVLAACRYYHALLPLLFERLDDETELLLPDDLLTDHSVAHGFRSEITDEDCAEVEILGWLYQFYISEKKDQVMARKTAVPSEDIPAVTQLFTPHWIVRYLVENSLGRLWLRSRPRSSLRASMPYYVEDPDGQAPADSLTVERPEDIRLLDPACGSGHMLTYAFDLLYQIYEEEGYAPADIPTKILTHNLYGLEICPRATQLAQFALLAKAREKSRNAFRGAIQPQVVCLEDVPFEAEELKAWLSSSGLTRLFTAKVLQQVYQFRENTSTFGSLVQPILTEPEIIQLKTEIANAPAPADLLLAETQRKVLLALTQAEMLTQRYHVVVTNPPYLGGGAMNDCVRRFSSERFPDSKSDLFAMFIERCATLARDNAYFALITMQNWMFLSSYEALRRQLLSSKFIVTMAHLGPRAFDTIGGEVVQATAFVAFKGSLRNGRGRYFRLVDGDSEAAKEGLFRLANASGGGLRFDIAARDMDKIPGSPVAYWCGPALVAAFEGFPPLASAAVVRKGLVTLDDASFVRLWFEVGWSSTEFGVAGRNMSRESPGKWFPLNKGGGNRRWFGLNETLINWKDDGKELKSFIVARYGGGSYTKEIRSEEYYFKPNITWSSVTTGPASFRHTPPGFLFSSGGSSMFCEENLELILLVLNSVVARACLGALAPTMNYVPGDVAKIPLAHVAKGTSALARSLTSLARTDWNNFETSWDFQDLPLLRPELKGPTLEASWQKWERYLRDCQCRCVVDPFLPV